MSRQRLRTVARAAFLVAVVAFAAWGLQGSWRDLVVALSSTPLPGLAVAAGLVLLGLLTTCGAWLRLLAGYGHRLPREDGRRVFFVGQLGKYIPGSVWSMGAHADLARGFGVPVRVTVGTSLAFLGLNVATAGLLAFGMLAAGMPTLPLPRWAGLLGALGCAVALTPPVVARLGTLVAGSAGTLRLTWGALAVLVGRMALTWTCYAGAMVALIPGTTPGHVAELLAIDPTLRSPVGQPHIHAKGLDAPTSPANLTYSAPDESGEAEVRRDGPKASEGWKSKGGKGGAKKSRKR